MTKAKYIEHYGIERYEQHKAQCNARRKERYMNDPEFRESQKARMKERYHNDPEYRESHNARCKERYHNDYEYRKSHITKDSARRQARYVEDGRIDLIENYELAVKNNFDGWVIHHRLELHPDCTVRFTRQSLIKLELYYNRPPAELKWLRCSEHKRIHNNLRASYNK